ncbi:MAG TPA: serine hydrolase domain-containing protein [Acidimicrobiales bacterium]|nr:serine hydrolase domain-containing protein [Acidimicrobiales bacterium]
MQKTFAAYPDADPTFSAQLCVQISGEPVVDLACGAMEPDSLLPVYSSSKGATAVVVSLLVDRGQLDLDERVASYWPEFAQRGKGVITVRQLLSHQAGLPGVDGGYSWEEVITHDALAKRLAAQRPFWQPGQAFMYHALTIGTLADELVRRIDGRRASDVLRADVTGPRGIDVWMGTPESEDHRIVPALPPTGDELTAFLLENPGALDATDPLTSTALPRGNLIEMLVRVNDVDMRRTAPPAAGVLASARGLADLYASLRHEVNGQPRLVSDETIAQMSQVQVAGTEVGTGLTARFGVIFQAPCAPRWPFGSVRAFGHDGAGGSLAFCDPTYDISFGYTVQRLPLPGGMDVRALELAALVRQCLS